MLFRTLFILSLSLSLFSSFPLISASVDPTSIPLLITLWTNDCSQPLDINDQIGKSVVPSNHPCWNIEEKQSDQQTKQYYGSRLDNGTLTLYQYAYDSIFSCQINTKTVIHQNITIGKCIPGRQKSINREETSGISLDWAPSNVTWTGVYSYIGYYLFNSTIHSGCSDILDSDRPLITSPGMAREPNVCYRTPTSILATENRKSQKRILDTSIPPYHISECSYSTIDCTGKSNCNYMENYPINECTPQQMFQQTNAFYYYWTVFGKPIETTTISNNVTLGGNETGTNITSSTAIPTSKTPFATVTGPGTGMGTGRDSSSSGIGSENINNADMSRPTIVITVASILIAIIGL